MPRLLACTIMLLASTTLHSLPPRAGRGPQVSSAAAAPTPQAGPRISAAEELKAALMPFEAARQQPDDLTEADLLALKLGRNRAAAACLRAATSAAATPTPSAATPAAPGELLALARLCLFGQAWAQAQKAATQYLALDLDEGRRTAQESLAEAFLGLHDPVNAAIQVRSLLSETAFDSSLETLLMRVLETGALRQGQWASLTPELCTAQVTNSLKLLEAGTGSSATDGPSPAQLVRDSLFCLCVLRLLHEPLPPEAVKRLHALPVSPQWKSLAESLPMALALARFDSEQKQTPVLTLHGERITVTGPSAPRTLHLEQGSFLFVASALWASDTARVVSDLATAAPSLPFTLLTSWAVNGSENDEANPQVRAALRGLAAQLPRTVSLVVVPNRDLEAFHLDVYPAAIALTNGTVQASTPLNGETAERMALIPLGRVRAPGNHPQATAGRP